MFQCLFKNNSHLFHNLTIFIAWKGTQHHLEFIGFCYHPKEYDAFLWWGLVNLVMHASSRTLNTLWFICNPPRQFRWSSTLPNVVTPSRCPKRLQNVVAPSRRKKGFQMSYLSRRELTEFGVHLKHIIL